MQKDDVELYDKGILGSEYMEKKRLVGSPRWYPLLPIDELAKPEYRKVALPANFIEVKIASVDDLTKLTDMHEMKYIHSLTNYLPCPEHIRTENAPGGGALPGTDTVLMAQREYLRRLIRGGKPWLALPVKFKLAASDSLIESIEAKQPSALSALGVMFSMSHGGSI